MQFRLRHAAYAVASLLLSACADVSAPTAAPIADTPRFDVVSGRPNVVISQIYGAGGNVGATIKRDYIELHNISANAVNLAGWSVQYASSTGNSWQSTALSGTLQPGAYYLVGEAAGSGGTVDLPTTDASGGIAMAAGAGKVILSRTTALLSGTQCPTGGNIEDQVAYGSTSSCSVEWFGLTPTLSASLAALRADNGCRYTPNAAQDFATGAPAPRNSASTTNTCSTVVIGPVATVTVTPSTASAVIGATQAFSAAAVDGQGQTVPSPGISWTTSDATVATVDANGLATAVGLGTATITATSSNNTVGTASLTVVAAPSLPSVRIAEIHYDNSSGDVGEAVEIEAPAGTDLTGWSVVLYNGNGGVPYDTRALSGVVSSQCSGRGVVVVQYATNGIQNGGTAGAEPDGLALVNAQGVTVEFLSYEGAFTATSGPAAGIPSRNIVAMEDNPVPPAGKTLQRSLADTWALGDDNFGGCNGRTAGTGLVTFTFTGRLTTDAFLPVGFQDQLFATVRRGGTSTNEAVVWSAETPSVATIDSRGVMTAVSAGDATFRATTTDGLAWGTYTLTMTVATPWASPTYAGNTEFGEPADNNASDEIILRRAEYTTSFSKTRHIPNWVSYNLEATHIVSGQDRCDCFTFDPELVAAGQTAYTTADYTGAGAFAGYGIDRGHLVRSFDRTAGSLDNAHTYFFANIIPQASDNNQGPWAAFETYLGDLARFSNKEVYVIAGAADSIGTLKAEGLVTIPGSVWKVAVILPRDKGLADVNAISDLQVIAVIMPNVPGIRNVPWDTYVTTVDAVEMLSGYDVLTLLRNDIEIAVESNTRPPVAAVNGPYTASEGSSVAMSAAASTDPDNDALTYDWSFGDGGTATGVSPSHVYTQDGSYTVRLIATDVRGLADTVTTTATIGNVAPSIAAFAGATLLPGELYTATGSFTDPGADSWSATADYGDDSGVGALTLSGKSFTLSHVYTAAGSFTVTVQVSDDDVTSSRTQQVQVLTQAQASDNAAALALALDNVGRMNRGLAQSLAAKISAAANSARNGHIEAAQGQIQAALNELDALVRGGILSDAQAAGLRTLLQRILASLAV
jgi:DNA/RNA endonuclease G (NUC1)